MLFNGELTLNVNGKEMNINEKDLLTAELLEIGNSDIDQPDSYAEVALKIFINSINKHFSNYIFIGLVLFRYCLI